MNEEIINFGNELVDFQIIRNGDLDPFPTPYDDILLLGKPLKLLQDFDITLQKDTEFYVLLSLNGLRRLLRDKIEGDFSQIRLQKTLDSLQGVLCLKTGVRHNFILSGHSVGGQPSNKKSDILYFMTNDAFEVLNRLKNFGEIAARMLDFNNWQSRIEAYERTLHDGLRLLDRGLIRKKVLNAGRLLWKRSNQDIVQNLPTALRDSPREIPNSTAKLQSRVADEDSMGWIQAANSLYESLFELEIAKRTLENLRLELSDNTPRAKFAAISKNFDSFQDEIGNLDTLVSEKLEIARRAIERYSTRELERISFEFRRGKRNGSN